MGRFSLDKEDPTREKDELTFNRFDQIVVRGSWLDKTLAAKFLFSRRINEDGHFNAFDRTTGSFLNDVFGTTDAEKKEGVFDLKEELNGVLRGIMLNKQCLFSV